MDRIRSIIALARRQLVIAALADAIAWGLVSASIVALLAVAFVKIGGDRLPAIAQQPSSVDALVAARKRHDLALFPSERHGPRRAPDRAFLEERILAAENLPPDAWRRFGNLTQGTRRKLWIPVDAELTPADDGFWLRFDLPAGSYATVLLEEIL